MRPQICPRPTSKDTSFSATMPPKRTDRPLIASSGASCEFASGTKPPRDDTLLLQPQRLGHEQLFRRHAPRDVVLLMRVPDEIFHHLAIGRKAVAERIVAIGGLLLLEDEH